MLSQNRAPVMLPTTTLSPVPRRVPRREQAVNKCLVNERTPSILQFRHFSKPHVGKGYRELKELGEEITQPLFVFSLSTVKPDQQAFSESGEQSPKWVSLIRYTAAWPGPDPRPGAKPRNRTSQPGWPSLLAFAEWLKMSEDCWRVHLQSLALGPLSAPHCTGHQIPQALRDVYFCVL